MAHLHLGINGPVSGKVGNLVYYIYRGKNYVRRAPIKSKKAPTLKQEIQRAKFGLAVAFASPVAKLVNQSYKLINRKKAGSDMLIRRILSEAIIGKYPKFEIDFSKVQLIKGSLPHSRAVMEQKEHSNRVYINWDMCGSGTSLDDELIVMMYSNNTGKWLLSIANCSRMDESCLLMMDSPEGGERSQIWIAFRSANRKAYSDSEFLGEVNVNKTASYEN
ncbi:MAG: DUF6266 family protein [Daejeonella sp.]|uniref:DUF6266 family protein n=1 Tax=Daejeonella sp. TaxID=2805397 RepID=UPI003C783D57